MRSFTVFDVYESWVAQVDFFDEACTMADRVDGFVRDDSDGSIPYEVGVSCGERYLTLHGEDFPQPYTPVCTVELNHDSTHFDGVGHLDLGATYEWPRSD